MKIIIFVFASLFFIFIASPAFSEDKPQGPTPEKIKQVLADIDEYSQKGMKEFQIPGMSIAIVRGDDVIFSKGFGVKNVDGKDPVTEDTIFQIGSTSKAFTATVMAMLEDEGKFKWDEQVINYLSDFIMYDPWVTREFQVWDLMAQHSGLPGYSADQAAICGFDRAYLRSILRYIKPVTSFRAKYAYQNHLFLVASQLMEKLSGKSWEDNMKERIFAPLNMENTSCDLASFQQARDVSSLHVKAGEKIMALPRDWKYMDWVYTYGPAGGINSNIKDMAKWLKFQINSGALAGKQLVSKENIQFLQSPKTVTEADFNGRKAYYCQGWLYMEGAPYAVIWHNGGTTGMKTMVAFIPEAKIGIVILSNLITSFPEALAFRFFDEYFGAPVKDVIPDMLAKEKKALEEARAKLPKKPESPAAAMPLEKYAGNYSNPVYGKIKVEAKDDTLVVTVGPRPVQLFLTHWDRDIFTVSWPNLDFEEFSGDFAGFQAGPEGKIISLTIDAFNQDGCGVFERKE